MRIIVVSMLVTLVGCRADATGTDTSPSGSVAPPKSYTPPACGGTGEGMGSATCAACAESSCCGELEACAPGTPCGDLIACRSTCAVATCVEACRNDHPGGVEAASAYDGCLAGPCAADCPRNPGVCGSSFSTGHPPCDGCVDAACCDVLSSCQGDASCSGCLEGFSEGCDGDALFSELTSCLRASCASSCDG